MTVVFNRVVGGHVYRVRVVHRPEPTYRRLALCCRQRLRNAWYIVFFLSHTVCLTLSAGLVSYDGDDSQSDSETPNELKFTAKVDNVRVIISRLAVAVSLWLAVPPLGVRTPY